MRQLQVSMNVFRDFDAARVFSKFSELWRKPVAQDNALAANCTSLAEWKAAHPPEPPPPEKPKLPTPYRDPVTGERNFTC